MSKRHKHLPPCMGFAPVRNKWAAKCGHCGKNVPAGNGFTHKIRGTANGWFVTHGHCQQEKRNVIEDGAPNA